MKDDVLRKIISQIRKYNLEKEFDTPDDFNKWLNRLSVKQINNFNSLMVDPSEIHFPLKYLINYNLLNCDDYNDRIIAMINLKNSDGCYHVFDHLCSPNFLNSEHYYKDMQLISKAPSALYPLWIVNNDVFINSPYHEEDLKYIVGAKDTPKVAGKEADWYVAEALTRVACCDNSIKSPYHQDDMQLISHAGSECLNNDFFEPGLNNLATNSDSLNDKYHLENMKIYVENPALGKYLYELMTNPDIIRGEYYRDEINALVTAKSLIKACAIYCHIINPDKYYALIKAVLDDYNTMDIIRFDSVKGSDNPNYLQNLALLNQIDDKYVLFVESLLSYKNFTNSKYCEHDLNLLLSTQDKDVFLDLYHLMFDEISLNGNHHIRDLDIISKADSEELRKLLISKAKDKNSVDSCYHYYDMEYISNLNLDSIDEETLKLIRYYLFNPDGINHHEHIERLERLLKDEIIPTEDVMLRYFDYLENGLNDGKFSRGVTPRVLSKTMRNFKNQNLIAINNKMF